MENIITKKRMKRSKVGKRPFAERDIQVLMSVGKLTPLGDPASNAPKWFAAVEMIRLVTDQEWLHRATREIAKYLRQKRQKNSSLHLLR